MQVIKENIDKLVHGLMRPALRQGRTVDGQMYNAKLYFDNIDLDPAIARALAYVLVKTNCYPLIIDIDATTKLPIYFEIPITQEEVIKVLEPELGREFAMGIYEIILTIESMIQSWIETQLYDLDYY